MNRAQHTPGPWSFDPENGEIRAPSGVIADSCTSDFTVEQDEYNGRIMAAGPDLLASLVEIKDMLWSRPDVVEKLRPLMGFAEQAISERAAAAIAKAEGRS